MTKTTRRLTVASIITCTLLFALASFTGTSTLGSHTKGFHAQINSNNISQSLA